MRAGVYRGGATRGVDGDQSDWRPSCGARARALSNHSSSAAARLAFAAAHRPTRRRPPPWPRRRSLSLGSAKLAPKAQQPPGPPSTSSVSIVSLLLGSTAFLPPPSGLRGNYPGVLGVSFPPVALPLERAVRPRPPPNPRRARRGARWQGDMALTSVSAEACCPVAAAPAVAQSGESENRTQVAARVTPVRGAPPKLFRPRPPPPSALTRGNGQDRVHCAHPRAPNAAWGPRSGRRRESNGEAFRSVWGGGGGEEGGGDAVGRQLRARARGGVLHTGRP